MTKIFKKNMSVFGTSKTLATGTRTELWFGHGCSGHRMLLEHERNYGLGMEALVTVCLWNTNGIMVWACMLWSPYALGTRTELWFGHGFSGHRMVLEHERNYGLGMDALVTVCSWNTNGIMVWAWILWSPYGLGTRTELWFGHGCSGHRMLLEHERNYGLGMEALVTVCLWNTNGIMVWACRLWSPYALGARTELWFGHGFSGHRMLSQNTILRRTQAEERKCLKTHGQICAVDQLPDGNMGMCPASPGRWRTRSQTPSIPFNNPYSTPLCIPYITALRSLDYGSYGTKTPKMISIIFLIIKGYYLEGHGGLETKLIAPISHIQALNHPHH